MQFMTTTQLMQHHRDLLNNLELLAAAEPGWNAADRKRGEASRTHNKREIARVEAELHMAGARRARA